MEQVAVSRDAAKDSVDRFVEQLRQRMHRALESGMSVDINLKDVQTIRTGRFPTPSNVYVGIEGDTPIAVTVTIGARQK